MVVLLILKMGQYGIPLLGFRINLLFEAGIAALVFEVTKRGFVILEKSYKRKQTKKKGKF